MALLKSSRMQTSNNDQHLTVPTLLLVCQPNTPGQQEIADVREELSRIRRIAPFTTVRLGEDGIRDTILADLSTHRWIHLSCHGSQDLHEPFKSCLHLHDGELTLLDIIKARPPHAEFAFLSACHTATGDKSSPDETIHLAAALQFSGFRSVIGTLWAMADIDGPVIAEEVYQHMFRRRKGDKGKLLVDFRDAAEALSIATKRLRDNGVPVDRWINFVHIGA